MEANKIYQGDCLKLLTLLPNMSIDCVVTSPPYNLGGDFHICNRGIRTTYGTYDAHSDKMPEKEYQANQIEMLCHLYRVTKMDSFCFYVHKERIVKNDIISPIEWIRESGWLISQVIVLDMGATANVDKRRFFPVHEYVYVLCKHKDAKLHNEEKLTDVWKVKKTPRKISGHPATFDIQVPERCIRAATKEGDIVLDAYMGVGTTALAALKNSRRYIGFEISQKYCEIAREKIKEMEKEK